ncbi:threonine/serine exporter family protein [Permianibacter sp. IMCC34836]|uniref:threonine/serine ThrE exporter family protein n=1 Tax=Permianibacter fluminis TaxID=2738515 RepID=UPI001551F435|nr:threonine/serine exporter family protein [Permianibacter fluminis]NQD37101.1 threonine/serine exporter family protein [Permianibacter fluminis]
MIDESRWPAADTPTGFVLRLAKALHTYGTPAYELERIINDVAKKLGFGLECFSLPTMITLSLFEPDRHSSFVIRVAPGDINLEKLTRSHDLAERVLHGEIAIAAAAQELATITTAPPRWGQWAVIFSFGLVSSGVARVFGGDWAEMLSSLLIGVLVGGLAIWTARSLIWTYMFPTLAALLAALTSYALASALGHTSVFTTLVSGVIVLLPGLMITVGLAELATQNLVSGTARLSGAAILFVLMGFGVAVGDQLGVKLFPQLVYTAPKLLPVWTEWPAVLLAGLGFVALFQARMRDGIWVVLAGLIAYSSARYGSSLLGPVAGAFCGAFVIGGVSHLFRFIFDRPNSIMLVPGIILLVPGSVGFRSLHALLEQNVVAGLDIAFQMILAGISLVIGLLLSSVFALPTRRERIQRGEVA